MSAVRTVFLIVAAMLLPTLAPAHHNWQALFDTEGDVEFVGTISSVQFRNPHVRIGFIVDAGTPQEREYWTESNSVASLTRMGITRDLLAVGTTVRVAGYPSRRDDDGIFMNHLLLPDGREIVFLRTAEARWPDEGRRVGNTDVAHGRVVEDDIDKRPTSIFGVWSTIYGAAGSHRALGGPVDWTEYGRRQPPAPAPNPDSCASRGFLTAFGSPYPIELVDNGETIAINAEYYDTQRIIHMQPMPADPAVPDDGIGFSAGHWVGDTLVVATLLRRPGGRDGDEFLQVHETFHLSEDRNRLAYTQIIIDPLMRAMPTVAKKWWQYVPGSFVQPYDCAE